MTWTAAESELLGLINRDRSARRLPALTATGPTIHRCARRHSRDMAAAAVLDHDDFPLADNWTCEAQNVGFGPTVGEVHAAFMASKPHRENILWSELRRVGIGVARVDGRVWVTQNFVAP